MTQFFEQTLNRPFLNKPYFEQTPTFAQLGIGQILNFEFRTLNPNSVFHSWAEVIKRNRRMEFGGGCTAVRLSNAGSACKDILGLG